MKPYYETELGKLYHGDCLEIMPELEPVDLVLTDPPYGVNENTKRYSSKRGCGKYNNGWGVDWDSVYGDDKPFDPAQFLSFKNIVLWGANHYADQLPKSSCWFVWDKNCGRAGDDDVGDCELAWVRGLKYKTVRIFRHMWSGFKRDSEIGQKHLHPTQKPIDLMLWCLSFFPNSSMVGDYFVGSGAVLVACERLKKKWIGVEIEEKYCEIAAKRIERERKQLKLF